MEPNDTECNSSLPYTLDNVTLTEHYVSECLDIKICMTVAKCIEYVEKHVQPEPLEWLMVIIYGIIFFVGLVGNGLVCVVVLKSRHMRTVVNIFIVNLAVADFMVLLFCLPPSLLADTTESWYLGDTMCKVVSFLQTVSVAVSVLTLGAISVERYFAICHPMHMRLTAVTISFFIIGIWLSAMLVALPELLYQTLRRTFPEHITKYLQYCQLELPTEHQKYYQIFLMVGLYDFPMCLMFFAYTTISLRLWRDNFYEPAETSPPTTDIFADRTAVRTFSANRPEHQLGARRKAAKMLMTIVVIFAVCYLPIHIFNILRYNGNLHTWNNTVIVTYALVARCLCYCNSAINPLIYNFMSGRFRQEFRAAFTTCHCHLPCRGSVKEPMALYNFRVNRSTGNGQNRSERYSMNTLTSRQGWLNNTNTPTKKANV